MYDLSNGFVSSDLDFKVTGLLGLYALYVLCAQLTRDQFAIAKFLLYFCVHLKACFQLEMNLN